jgi:fatty acid desaturase
MEGARGTLLLEAPADVTEAVAEQVSVGRQRGRRSRRVRLAVAGATTAVATVALAGPALGWPMCAC